MRKKAKSKYPVGARWTATNEQGMIGEIWLSDIAEYFEVWRWSVRYSDGSGYRSDWGTSYRFCREEIPIWNNHGKSRLVFKRVGDHENRA